jgi:hypothetical protein
MALRYPNFLLALMALGGTDRERAAALGVSIKSLARYRNGDIPAPLLRLAQHPHVLRACCRHRVRGVRASWPLSMAGYPV